MDSKHNEVIVLESKVKQYNIEAQRLEQQVNDMKGQLLEQQLEADSAQVNEG